MKKKGNTIAEESKISQHEENKKQRRSEVCESGIDAFSEQLYFEPYESIKEYEGEEEEQLNKNLREAATAARRQTIIASTIFRKIDPAQPTLIKEKPEITANIRNTESKRPKVNKDILDPELDSPATIFRNTPKLAITTPPRKGR